MARAKNMIALAQSINAQLAAASANDPSSVSAETAEAASLATSSLQSLGLLSAPVTAQDVADSSRYQAHLAQELAGVLQKGQVMEKQGGVIGLDEVWCLWNRARGVSLVSPVDLRAAARHLPSASPSFRTYLRVFPSGLHILHTSRFSLPAFSSRILELLDLRQALTASLADEGSTGLDRQTREGLGVLEVADAEKLSVGLAKEMMELLEFGEATALGGRFGGGAVVRDEQGGEGTRWQRNYISEAVWDGQVL
ncbi:vacuolar protein sorting protein VPS36 [Rhodotorula toruloides]|uniref:Vacuolar protein-sorting-associated protein 36 n=1 Tax=Rhodotorula toruloides TaxID=5286 RepID=A0A511KM62_RHOTO|nr:vacuolar protein sorting protein VPS36 [Rhodotorula toruloides]